MPVKLNPIHDGKILEIEVNGTLGKDDYEGWIPEVNRLIEEHGKLRILFHMSDFHGWSAGGLWEDIKFDLKHFKDIERLAMAGEKRWQKGMSVFCKPFTTAEIRYFEKDDLEEARGWIQEGLPAEARARPGS